MPKIPDHIRIGRLKMGDNGLLRLPPQLAEALDLQAGCEVIWRADTKDGTLTLQRLYGFVPQVLENDGANEEARLLVAEIMAGLMPEEDGK